MFPGFHPLRDGVLCREIFRGTHRSDRGGFACDSAGWRCTDLGHSSMEVHWSVLWVEFSDFNYTIHILIFSNYDIAEILLSWR